MRRNGYGELLEAPKAKRVLLYSGGLDSFVVAKLWRPDVLLYVATGHRYEAHERHAMWWAGLPVVIDGRLRLGDLERLDGIVPLRNLYFLAIASHYGDTIAMGVLDGEVNGDKSVAFARQAEAVLATCYGPSYWSEGRAPTVEYPVAHLTKAELVAEYLAAGHDPQALLATRSCYDPGDLPCGHCSACVKRHIALAANGLRDETVQDPATSPYLDEIKARWGTYNAKRRQETLAAFPMLCEAVGA